MDIAVIGVSGAFPQAENVDAFWRNILEGRDCISEVPSSRWPVGKFYDERPAVPGKSSSKWMGVLEQADRFDPLFFSISPGEAAAMDPSSASCSRRAGLASKRRATTPTTSPAPGAASSSAAP
ncbi:hypothetical protein LV779_34530 [Streptomyces thinghirensis]|nr:hypothetical protein [Streptomyces thinghirensis]